MTTKSIPTSTIFRMWLRASLLALAVGCGSNQVSIGQQNVDGSVGGASGSQDAPVISGGSTSNSTAPQGGSSVAGGTTAAAGSSSSVVGGSGGSTLLGGSRTGGSSGTASSSLPPDDRCGGEGGLQCASGSFCDYGACGTAITDAMGICVVKPQVCTKENVPVCGCDRVTYSNDCMRRSAGVGKASDGACGGAGGRGGTGGKTATGGSGGTPTGGTTGSSSSGRTPCISNGVCGAGAFCDYPTGGCGQTDFAGVCVSNAGIGGCLAVWQPVCGCNGKTYPTDCDRIIAGVSKRSDGECPKADGGASDAASSEAALCVATGGEVKPRDCCTSSGDFPNSCLVGACSCAPTSSHSVSACSCPTGCFLPGTGCVGATGKCTVGMNQTCNDNSALSSIHGRCLTDGRCVCNQGFALLASGKCE